MCSHSWNKLITISFALAAGGVLACAGALLDVFIPSGSLVGFLARMLVLGFAITGVVIGFTWGCDKCESYVQGRLDRLLNIDQPELSRQVPVRKEKSQWTLQFGYRQ